MRLDAIFSFAVVVCIWFSPFWSWGESTALDSLRPIKWAAKERLLAWEHEPIAILFEATGDVIDADYADIEIERRPFYENPLSCCAAAITAIVKEEEDWWGQVSAPVEVRGSDGRPRPDFKHDSSNNLYSMYTFYKNAEYAPQYTGGRIETYLRIGDIHVFDVQWTLLLNGVPTDSGSSGVTVEEFRPGKFRLATEYMRPENATLPLIWNTNTDVSLIEEYINKEEECVAEIVLDDVFGETVAYPLAMRFRRIKDASNPLFRDVQSRIHEVHRIIRVAEVRWLDKNQSVEDADIKAVLLQELSPYLSAGTLQSLRKRPLASMVAPPFGEEVVVIVDAKSYVMAFTKLPGGLLSPDYVGFTVQGEDLILSTYGSQTLLSRFISRVAWDDFKKIVENQEDE